MKRNEDRKPSITSATLPPALMSSKMKRKKEQERENRKQSQQAVKQMGYHGTSQEFAPHDSRSVHTGSEISHKRSFLKNGQNSGMAKTIRKMSSQDPLAAMEKNSQLSNSQPQAMNLENFYRTSGTTQNSSKSAQGAPPGLPPQFSALVPKQVPPNQQEVRKNLTLSTIMTPPADNRQSTISYSPNIQPNSSDFANEFMEQQKAQQAARHVQQFDFEEKKPGMVGAFTQQIQNTMRRPRKNRKPSLREKVNFPLPVQQPAETGDSSGFASGSKLQLGALGPVEGAETKTRMNFKFIFLICATVAVLVSIGFAIGFNSAPSGECP